MDSKWEEAACLFNYGFGMIEIDYAIITGQEVTYCLGAWECIYGLIKADFDHDLTAELEADSKASIHAFHQNIVRLQCVLSQ